MANNFSDANVTIANNSLTDIFPSPIFPVLATSLTAWITLSTVSSLTANSILVLGRKSTKSELEFLKLPGSKF